MNKVAVEPALLRWARQRARIDIENLQERFPKLKAWEQGEAQPTLKQLEDFAKATYVPVGYLFLSEPPAEEIPIQDLRTVGNRPIDEPSPNLREMIYLCQRRQDWYRDYALSVGEEPRSFEGSADINSPIEETAAAMRETLNLDSKAQADCKTWKEALRMIIGKTEEIGVLVMTSGVVGNNTHRKLDPMEFRGFALSDKLAPLIFINSQDSIAARMFTLAHELAHIWLGESAISDAGLDLESFHSSEDVETWCNKVAAELLVPSAEINNALQLSKLLDDQLLKSLAQKFKVSTLVILRRLFDTGHLSLEDFKQSYKREFKKSIKASSAGGGNFYHLQTARVSRRFARALVTSTFEGRTLYRDAFKMLCINNEEIFRKFAKTLQESL